MKLRDWRWFGRWRCDVWCGSDDGVSDDDGGVRAAGTSGCLAAFIPRSAAAAAAAATETGDLIPLPSFRKVMKCDTCLG